MSHLVVKPKLKQSPIKKMIGQEIKPGVIETPRGRPRGRARSCGPYLVQFGPDRNGQFPSTHQIATDDGADGENDELFAKAYRRGLRVTACHHIDLASLGFLFDEG